MPRHQVVGVVAAADRVRDVPAAAELERYAEGVAQRKAEHGADDPFGLVHDGHPSVDRGPAPRILGRDGTSPFKSGPVRPGREQRGLKRHGDAPRHPRGVLS